MAVKIIFNEENRNVQKAVDLANQLLNNSSFYELISEKDSFDLSTATPVQVAEILKNSKLEYKVEFFYPNITTFIKYRKTLAYTDSRFQNTLFLNFKKLNRSVESIAATVIHEAIHAVDHSEEDYTFGHGNNSSKGKKNTAPYWIGNLAYSLLSKQGGLASIDFDVEEDDAIA